MSLRSGLHSFRSSKGAQAVVLVVLLALLAVPSIRLLAPAPANARAPLPPVKVGASFSPQRAQALGLDYQVAFQRLLAMRFRLIRLSAYWSEIDASGYGDLDWLMSQAQRAHQPVVLSVGMKGLGWPEFFVPDSLLPAGGIPEGHDVAEVDDLRQAALAFVDETVRRYRDNRALYAWQVENEPFNRAGPERWWIDPGFVREEMDGVRLLDHHDRPLILNSFSHFNLLFDQASNRDGLDLTQLLGFGGDTAVKDSLGLLAHGDVMGLDVYTAIGYRFLGVDHLSRADSDWPDRLEKLRQTAQRRGRQAWITEAQAEPWEASPDTYSDPRSTSPAQIRSLFQDLKEAGFNTILLWGSEYWLWRSGQGDQRWIDTVQRILNENGTAA
jgi:hypothetical protein